jgi:uncharacterized tellurite resistance protein B-like protein
MFDLIKNLLQSDPPADKEQRFERVQVATCALLLEVAHSDGEYKTVEAKLVHDLLAKKFQLSPAAIAELVDYSHDHREQSLDLFQFARVINAHFSNEEKLDIMEGIWQIIYADGVLDKFEDALARQLATLLRLSHKDVIDRKVKVLDEVDPDRGA